MPSFASQVRLLRVIQELLLGDGSAPLPHQCPPKPDFHPDPNMTHLPRSTPEREGLDSARLDAFYREMSNHPDINAHSMMVLRHGKVVAEGWFSPYRADIWHITHSMSKTLTGTAVGLALEEGLFALDDRVADYFPEKTGLFTPGDVRKITVRQLLTMSSGIAFNEVSAHAVDNDWIRGLFAAGTSFPSGSKMSYNSMNSYLLAALVAKTSGEPLLDYLRPRLLAPMGFGPIAWETCPAGYEKGGWGLYMMPEDMAKLGQLYLQKGAWEVDGKMRQLLAREWVEDATRVQTVGDEGETYGYHIWIDGDSGAYIMSGMFGQCVVVIPDQEMVITMTAGNTRLFITAPAFTVMRDYFYPPNTAPGALPENPPAYAALQSTLRGLRFARDIPPAQRRPKPLPGHVRRRGWGRPAAHRPPPPDVSAFCGTVWQFPKSRASLLPVVIQAMDNNFTTGVAALKLEMQNGTLGLYWEEDGGTAYLPVGLERPIERVLTVKRESYVVATSGEVRQNEDGEDVLKIEICFLEHSSCRLIKLLRRGEKIYMQLDEVPQFSVAIESAIGQQAATSPSRGGESIREWIFGSEATHRRVEQLCTPKVWGTAVHPPSNGGV